MHFRIAALVCALVPVPGIYGALQGGGFETMLLWLAIGAGGAGVISSFRLWPMTWFTSRGERRLQGAWPPLFADAALVVGVLLGATTILLLLVLAGVLYPGGRVDWGAIPVVGLAGAMLVAFGILVGTIILIPIGSLVAQLVRGVNGEKVDARIVWGGIMLLLVVAAGTLVVLAVDTTVRPRGVLWATLPAVLFGIDTPDATIRSEPLLWGARAVIVALIGSVVGLVRAGGGRRAPQ